MNGAELKDRVQNGGIVYGTMISMGRNPALGFGVLEFRDRLCDYRHGAFAAGQDGCGGFHRCVLVQRGRAYRADTDTGLALCDDGAGCGSAGDSRAVLRDCGGGEGGCGAAKWRPLKGELVRKAVDSGEFPSQATKDYLEARNRNNVCIVGIESVPAIENLENILKVGGIDAIFVGPNDLSITLGIPDQYDHPDYEAALREIISKCQAAGVPTLIHHQTVDLTVKWLQEGARFVLYSSDARSMHNAYRDEFGAIKAAGAELGGGMAEDVGESEEVI